MTEAAELFVWDPETQLLLFAQQLARKSKREREVLSLVPLYAGIEVMVLTSYFHDSLFTKCKKTQPQIL